MNVCFHGEVILPDRMLPDTYLICEEDRIVMMGSTIPSGIEIIESPYIAPGFIDLHVHGGRGADYMDGSAEAVRIVNRAHARHGTTTIFPTTTTGSTVEIERMLSACAAVKGRWSVSHGAHIGGVHYYGPYFAEEKVGCHSLEGRRDPDPAEYERFFALGLIRIATCAAELPGAEAFYRSARKHGCLVTCGHSNSTWTEMARAYDVGVRHVDHFWCAMSSVPSVRARCGTRAPLAAAVGEESDARRRREDI